MTVVGPFTVTPRARPSAVVRFGVPFVALLAALLVGGLLILVTGADPVEAYQEMYDTALGGRRPLTRTLTAATPLILTGLCAAVAFRMRVYNIGGEGQLYLGAMGAATVALSLPDGTPGPVMLVLVMLGGALAGAVWAALAALPKAYLGADEVLTTLMLNFVALGLMNYLIFGSMSFLRDPGPAVPQGEPIPESAELPTLSGRLHAGILIALVAAVLLWWLLRSTTWGFRLRTIGDSPKAARYAGMPVAGMTVGVLAVSGAMAGLAGAVELSGVTKGVDPGALAVDLGYTGIVVAAVARFNPMGVVPVAAFLAAISTSGSSLQSVGVQIEVVLMLQGLVFLAVTAGEFLVTNRVRFGTRRPVPGVAG
jgi:ABC-type uncharacterized transport system permease subunit